jgi:hypothetical protein
MKKIWHNFFKNFKRPKENTKNGKTYDSPLIYENQQGFSWTHSFHHWNVAKNRSACFLNLCATNMSQPHFGINVRMKLTLPKVGSWSPPRLPKTQSLIARVKTPRIGVFFISMERSWNLNVQNGLVWAIWTSAAQVMGKRKVGSQTGNVTPDH